MLWAEETRWRRQGGGDKGTGLGPKACSRPDVGGGCWPLWLTSALAEDIQGLFYQLLVHWHISDEMHISREKPAMFETCNFGLTNSITFAQQCQISSFAQNLFLLNHHDWGFSITQGPQVLAFILVLFLNQTQDYQHGMVWYGREACTLAQFWNQGPDAQHAVGCCSSKWARSSSGREVHPGGTMTPPSPPPPLLNLQISNPPVQFAG